MDTLLIFLVFILLASQIVTLLLLREKNRTGKRLLKIYDIGKKITSQIKIKSLMKQIMEITQEETEAEACTLYLVDEEKQELWFEVALGGKGDLVREIRLKIGDGSIAGWVAREGVTLNIEDVNKDPRFMSSLAKKIDFKQKAMLTMPVKLKGKVIGVLQVINKKGGGKFTKRDEELLEGISSQVAIALENARLYKTMRDLFIDSIRSLANAVDAKDPYTNGHSQRVTEYSVKVGREMGLDEETMERLEYMAVLHDVGKIGIQDSILNKQARLDDEEFAVMKSHTQIGAKILGSMQSLKGIIPGVEYHHEKYDGTGYFKGLKGEEIPLEARIISVADTYDAMTTTRPYRKGLDHETAMKEINRCSGTQFDPGIVKCFNAVMEQGMEKDA